MAQAELNITIDKMSGKIYGESDVYITHRYGKTVISHYPKHRDPKSITPHQRDLNTSFAQLSKQAKVELADPENAPLGSNDMTNTKLIITRKTSTILPSVDL